MPLYAQWEPTDFDISFDTDSEPGDEDYPGVEKPDETVNVDDGKVEIENPTRPGYVFQGWVIPNASGTEAVGQELVYEEDGKWYVDASKLPDYATDGRIELTARWTSVISVDVPNSVTFYADTVTQGNESRDGLADRAFGQSKVASQSEVDLRIVGLESQEVKGDGSTSLGASDVLVAKDGASTPADSAWKLFSLYPSRAELTPEELQDPDRESTAPEGAVTFGLDDILLEKSFAADDFTIPAGDTLNLGYRLNLEETKTSLDYAKLSQLPEGGTASLANISYCFADDGLSPAEWGEPLWVNNPDRTSNPNRYLMLADIKRAAEDLATHADDPAQSEYYDLYKGLLDVQRNTSEGAKGKGPFFQLKVGDSYLDLQLIGICQDEKSAGGKAGLTFQLADIYAFGDKVSSAMGSGAFQSSVNASSNNAGGWGAASLRSRLRGSFSNRLEPALRGAIAPVRKAQQLYGGTTRAHLQLSTSETIWVPSMYEVFGMVIFDYNESEAIAADGYAPFQYLAYQGNGTSITNTYAIKQHDGVPRYWWLRSAYRADSTGFCNVSASGIRSGYGASFAGGVAPCFAI